MTFWLLVYVCSTTELQDTCGKLYFSVEWILKVVQIDTSSVII